jgi:hypothetical protein
MQKRKRLPNPSNSLRGRIGALSLALLLLPVLVGVLALYLISGLLLQFAIWLFWWPRGKYVLFIYSDSPNWKEYVESRLIPTLREKAVILNWSERKVWKTLSLASLAFRYFGGSREFNPMAVVLRPLHWAKTFRFYKAFQENKSGKPERLQGLQDALFAAIAD